MQLVSQCFVRSANKNTHSTLTSSPEGQVERNIAGGNTSAHANATKQLAVATEVARKIAQCNST